MPITVPPVTTGPITYNSARQLTERRLTERDAADRGSRVPARSEPPAADRPGVDQPRSQPPRPAPLEDEVTLSPAAEERAGPQANLRETGPRADARQAALQQAEQRSLANRLLDGQPAGQTSVTAGGLPVQQDPLGAADRRLVGDRRTDQVAREASRAQDLREGRLDTGRADAARAGELDTERRTARDALGDAADLRFLTMRADQELGADWREAGLLRDQRLEDDLVTGRFDDTRRLGERLDARGLDADFGTTRAGAQRLDATLDADRAQTQRGLAGRDAQGVLDERARVESVQAYQSELERLETQARLDATRVAAERAATDQFRDAERMTAEDNRRRIDQVEVSTTARALSEAPPAARPGDTDAG